MEFVIGNFEFESSKIFDDSIFYFGDIDIMDDYLVAFDGYFISEKEREYTSILNHIGELSYYKEGVYNIIVYSRQNKCLEIMNDREGIVPLYIYHLENKFIVSNNVWLIYKILSEIIQIDERSLTFQFAYYTDPNPERTLFKNIIHVSPSSYLRYDTLHTTLFRRKYWQFEYKPEINISIESIVEHLDFKFIELFTFLKSNNPNSIFGFGNSGGFDSRLIAYYSSLIKLPIKSFVICKKSRFLESTTELLSNKIAKVYGFDNQIIESTNQKILEQFLIDIRNNPFGPCEVYKNNLNNRIDYDIHLTGQPGGLAYILPPSIGKGNIDDLYKHFDYFLGFAQFSLSPGRYFMSRACKHLGVNFNKYNGALGVNNNLLYPLLRKFQHEDAYDEMVSIVNTFKGNSNVETWVRIHDAITTKYVYAGGYESLNRTKKTYYLYSPHFYNIIHNIPFEYFENKYIIRKLYKKIDKRLSSIPGQNFQSANNKGFSIFKKLEMGVRGRGMNIDYLLREKEFENFLSKVLLVKNDFFETFFESKKILYSPLRYSAIGLNIIKLKIMLDMISNKNIDVLFDDKFLIK